MGEGPSPYSRVSKEQRHNNHLLLQCSKICDGGVKYRKVRCQQLLALGEIADKPAKLCPKNSPDTERPCNPQPCSSYDYEKKAFDVRNDEALGCASEFDLIVGNVRLLALSLELQ